MKLLKDFADKHNVAVDSLECAQLLDKYDPLSRFRNSFLLPKGIYFCGNSLGPQPASLHKLLQEELQVWATQGVHGHTHHPSRPWVRIQDIVIPSMARIVGANPSEVTVMNSLTVNNHILLLQFYKPTEKRYKIVMEEKAFPSDRYAIESQLKLRGLDVKKALVVVKLVNGEIRANDVENVIAEDVALVWLGGVHYYSGHVLDMERITRAAHSRGCLVGFDLAHAAGNIPLQLHAWGVDFAAWCTYKYLNSGPGGIAGIFVHENHTEMPVLAGWWGNKLSSRFDMNDEFDVEEGAARFQMSNPSALSVVSLYASLLEFDGTCMEELRKKSELLTGYLAELLPESVNVITPKERRGCQLSLRVSEEQARKLEEGGAVIDKRHDIIRVAPAPLYNTFEEVWRFVELLK